MKYFKRLINIIDVLLIVLNIFTITIYLEYHNKAQEIEDISFAFLIFFRNFSQLLRLFVLIKNQKSISKNIEEVINLNVLFEEKKIEIMTEPHKYHNEVISFVNDEVSTTHSKYGGNFRNNEHHDFSNEIGNYQTENYKQKSNNNSNTNTIIL